LAPDVGKSKRRSPSSVPPHTKCNSLLAQLTMHVTLDGTTVSQIFRGPP
jgi:hypothetical protein